MDDKQKISLALADLRSCSAILYVSLLVGAHVPDVEVGYCRQRYKRYVSIASDLTINWLRSQHFLLPPEEYASQCRTPDGWCLIGWKLNN